MPILNNNHFDALIVGGGVIGMLTARNLKMLGVDVALIEKSTLGQQASWAAGGILSTLPPWNHAPSNQALIQEGQKHFADLTHELKQETGIDSEYIKSGMLVIEEHKRKAFAWAKSKNEIIECLESKSIQAKEPCLTKKFQQALYIPNIAQIRPPNLIQALHQSLLKHEIPIYENTPVKQIKNKNNKVIGIEARNISLHAENVVLCSGAWTRELLEPETMVDIEPVRGQMLLYKPDTTLLKHIVVYENHYLIPRQDGHILCGSTLEHVGFENEITAKARNELTKIAQELIPRLTKYEPIKQWSGLRPGTQRETPYISKHPNIKGLYLNSGHFRYGILMSIASANIISELIMKEQISLQIPAYA